MFKEWLDGLWATVCIGLTLLWDSAKSWWKKSSEAQKSIMLAVVIILVALATASVARAENEPKSGYGLWHGSDGSVACFMKDPNVDNVGSVYTCVALQMIGPSTYMANGMIAFCTITGVNEQDKPSIDCAATYQDARKLAGGV